MARKKIILFIVEGISDQTCLGLALSRLLTSNNIQFEITEGDITTRDDANSATIIKLLGAIIKKFLAGVFRPGDIQEVVHLVDTDGAFIPDTAVRQNTASGIFYAADCIYTNNIASLRARNAKKQQILNKLCSMSTILKNIPYSVYFFSCNLDHALHNENNLSYEEKMSKAVCFESRYANDLPGFISFLQNPAFAVSGDYSASWAFIKIGTNSLKRYSNFHLYPPLINIP